MNKVLVLSIIIVLIGIGCIYYQTGKETYEIHSELEKRYPALINESFREKRLDEKARPFIQEGPYTLKEQAQVLCSKESQPVIVLYEKRTAPRGYVGGWSIIEIVDCKENYYVYESRDTPPQWFGPF